MVSRVVGYRGEVLGRRISSSWEVRRNGVDVSVEGLQWPRGVRVDLPMGDEGWGVFRSRVVVGSGEGGVLAGRVLLDHPDDFAFWVGFWDSGIDEADSGLVTRFHGFRKGVGHVPVEVVGFGSGGELGLLPDGVWGEFGVDLVRPCVWAYGVRVCPGAGSLVGVDVRGGLFLRSVPTSLLGFEVSVASCRRVV